MPVVSRLGAMAMAGVTLVLGGLAGRALIAPAGEPAEPTTAMGSPTGEFPVQLAASSGSERLIPTQFILDDATARRVSIVGEFNEWKPGATPLTRLRNGVWTATVPLTEGRHVYAFVLDDTLLVADPRAPKAPDADFGREGSVVMVFAP
jgi:1,4-alpha-glucan branching enzyme